MKLSFQSYKKILPTLVVVLVAAFFLRTLWFHYMQAPWTRDGRIRVDIINIAPDVNGLVTAVYVKDNQHVQRGDILFDIDLERYRNAVLEAKANVAEKKADLRLRQAQAKRRQLVDEKVISLEDKDNAQLAVEGAEARYELALSELSQANLNLERTHVRSPVDGWVTNLLLRPGDFVHTGNATLALIDEHSFWVYGYFEENKVHGIALGDRAVINLLGTDVTMRGHVESIAHGIDDRDNPIGSRLLANVNPSFNWVRLAQRVPVRIKIDSIPNNVNIVAGMTCTVTLTPQH
ncbi:p-hydroxybenzoic acid efflux pump subunit AaeA [Ferrovum sp. JA12]|uniref:efflux RND transporter periplasmic adaptor subunit n=1 Tax=Ferrovum sp. JA12 TaxID=1356299 RepID=UPI0007033E7F|nr:HlyD family secretion protein [Ferrovum sp. JA12]KRH79742.1 p-hydroxybenzoic acid efflux pump subunit AaeA [Ferrovum sp. JA12]